MRLYHFTTAEDALNNIENRRVKIAEIKDLDDPFELQIANFGDKAARRRFMEFKRITSERYGLIRFCRDWKSPIVWSHHSDRHRGICLGFDVNDAKVREVSYVTERAEIELSQPLGQTVLDQLLYTKSKDWEFEHEFRIWTKLGARDPKSNVFFEAFDENLILREVIVGHSCPVNRAELEPLVEDYDPPIELTKARLAFKSFDILPQKLRLR